MEKDRCCCRKSKNGKTSNGSIFEKENMKMDELLDAIIEGLKKRGGSYQRSR